MKSAEAAAWDGGDVEIAQPYPCLVLVGLNTGVHRGRSKTITY